MQSYADYGFNRILADTQGRRVALSGHGLNVFAKQDIVDENRDKIAQVLLSLNGAVLKVFPDSRLIFIDKLSNVLYMYDMGSNQLMKSIKGKPYKRSPHETRVHLGYSTDGLSVLWRRTETTLSVISLQEFEIEKEITNFWPSVDSDVIYDSFAICDDAKANIVCVNKTLHYGTLICHYFGNGRIRHVTLSEIFKHGRFDLT